MLEQEINGTYERGKGDKRGKGKRGKGDRLLFD
jgi:hypothetical protein